MKKYFTLILISLSFFTKSILLKVIIIFSNKISLINIHSIACAWIHFFASIIKILLSIIEEPTIIVLFNEECTRQSIIVIWINSFLLILYYFDNIFLKEIDVFKYKAEKPKSNVIPLSLLWGFL